MSATAQGCGNAVNITAPNASGTNSTSVSSPVVFNYPVQPPDDTGRMMALASIIGGLFDAMLGGEGLDDAEDAQNVWKATLDNTMKPRGESELAMVDTQRSKLAQFETDLHAQLSDYRTKADQIWPRLDPINDKISSEIDEYRDKAHDEFDFSNVTCLDDAVDKLCEYVGCGYVPDYQGIATRARADAEIAQQRLYQEACRTGNRYNTRVNMASMLQLRLGTASAALAAVASAREAERREAVKTNHDWRFKHAEHLEKVRMGRREMSLNYDKVALDNLRERWKSFAEQYLELERRGDNVSTERWEAYMKASFDHFRLGGEMLASAMQAYQMLAASIRETSRQSASGGGLAGLAATLAAVIPMFGGGCDPVTIPLLGTQFYPRPQQCCGAAPAA